ncbi:hypothetical protein TREES_T100006283 [Tupaia chinensis]|uniref:Uncharacterized protein n=1 Tax=Tupaia chinensis TaxID=246437 RepID=L9L9D8_TUPCH|nr:hypothetical protein TREES_T100006283 [Tupaia chinensis]
MPTREQAFVYSCPHENAADVHGHWYRYRGHFSVALKSPNGRIRGLGWPAFLALRPRARLSLRTCELGPGRKAPAVAPTDLKGASSAACVRMRRPHLSRCARGRASAAQSSRTQRLVESASGGGRSCGAPLALELAPQPFSRPDSLPLPGQPCPRESLVSDKNDLRDQEKAPDPFRSNPVVAALLVLGLQEGPWSESCVAEKAPGEPPRLQG